MAWTGSGHAAEPSADTLGPLSGERAVATRVQILLSRTPFQPGSIDSRRGENTRSALDAFRSAHGLPPGGPPDARLLAVLADAAGEKTRPPLRPYTVTAEDLAGPWSDLPEDIYAKHELDCLCYRSAWESLAERHQTAPALLAALNPSLDLSALEAGDVLSVPDPTPSSPIDAPVDRIVIDVAARTLTAHAADGRVLRRYPTVVGDTYATYRGELVVTDMVHDPPYRLDPERWDEIPDELPAVSLPPGPNSPVGAVWMPLSADGFGIHGTADPETIGHTESHGCVRLTNWSALELAAHVQRGETTVDFVGLPPRG